MADYAKLIERLREEASSGDNAAWTNAALNEAADAIEALIAELAALSEAAMDADMYCWGPAYESPEHAATYARTLRILSQPNADRSNAAWRLLDELRVLRVNVARARAEGAAEAVRKVAGPCADALELDPDPFMRAADEALNGCHDYISEVRAAAKLAAEAHALGAAEEREACAKLADLLLAEHAGTDHGGATVACEFSSAYEEYRDAIRARGAAK